jgi:type IV secretory pathway VirB4 component
MKFSFKLPKLKKSTEETETITLPTQTEASVFEKIREVISPPGAVFNLSEFQVGDIYGKSIFVLTYPRYLFAGWLENILSLEYVFNLSLFFFPMDTPEVLKHLEKQLARIEGQIHERAERGLVRSPELQTAYQDIETIRDALIQARERMFEVGLYITIFTEDKNELLIKEKQIMKILESSLIIPKPILFNQEGGFLSTMPLGLDTVASRYQLNSSSAASFFPFISSELSMEQGTLFGINLQDNSLVIFDRFAFDNAHMVVFARSGAGKSYAAKIEIMRNLMLGIDTIVLDPENEYKSIAEVYGGSFIPVALKTDLHVNPFDLPPPLVTEEPSEVFKEKMSDLIGLLQILVGETLSADELTILDRALTQTYASFNILPDSDFSKVDLFPTLNDFEKILRSLEGGEKLADRLYPYTQGNFSGFINQPTNVELDKRIIVFGFRDLVEQLRPIGMYLFLSYILNKARREVKKRVIIIDEAWWIMKQEAGGAFLLNTIKRGRKYLLAITNITQDVEDFLNSPYGKPIITNSALVFLMKQSPATINLVGQVFALSEGEKNFLLQAERGKGILVAGLKRVPVYVLASYAEDQIIKAAFEQLMAIKQAQGGQI